MTIKPYQTIATLADNLDVSQDTVDNWVKMGHLPAPRRVGGKRLWSWSEVCKFIEGPRDTEADSIIQRITNATKQAAGETNHGRRVRQRNPGIHRVPEIP